MVKVFLKPGRDESLRRFHPWVFSGAVAQVQGSPAEGDLVAVYSADGQPLAAGHWQIGSIAVRILSFDADPTAPDFWVNSISCALAAREAVGLFSASPSKDAPRQNFALRAHPSQADAWAPPVHEATGGHGLTFGFPPGGSAENASDLCSHSLRRFAGEALAAAPRNQETNCFRLVHGEGDGLPGLIVDWYDGVCVLQAHSVGMFRAKMQICEALQQVFGDRLKAVYDKSSGTAPFKAGLDLVDGYLWRAPGFEAREAVVLENGRILPGPARQSRAGRPLCCRAPGAQPVLLYRGLQHLRPDRRRRARRFRRLLRQSDFPR